MNERYKIEYYEDLLEISSIIDTVENHELTAEEIVNLLNDLSDENERLQTHLSQLAKSNREGVKKVQSLAKENEQLKKSVKRQQSSNNECAKLIEKQQKEIGQLKEEIKDLNDALARYEEKELEND